MDIDNPDWQGGRPDDAWVGPVQLVLSNGETLIGKVSENDGPPGPSNGVGQGRDGSSYFDFGADGSFIVRYHNLVWPDFKKFGPAFVGNFRAQGKIDISNGTGRFTQTTGNVGTEGLYVAWNLDQPLPSGRFNNSITGTVCNVAAKPTQ